MINRDTETETKKETEPQIDVLYCFVQLPYVDHRSIVNQIKFAEF